MNGEWLSIWKDEVMAYSKVLSQHSLAESEDNHNLCKDSWSLVLRLIW
jgi:hypothetical protein